MQWVNIVILALTAFLLVPIVVLCAECLAALLPRRRRKPGHAQDRCRLAVLIPAHNEEKVLGATLQSLLPQLRSGDRVVVIADNCTDNTATVARENGAQVIERTSQTDRGKGYALDFGVRYLEANPPELVIMMDADCCVHEGAVDALAAQVAQTGQPAQAVYLLERPTRAGARDLVSALAFLVKNLVRPSGLGRLGLPCLLTGTGMAFPWSIIRRAKLASGNIVEDMQLGLDLALAGHPPLFCEHACVTGKLPQQRRAAITQRTRWEHGHLQTLLTQVPRLLKGAVLQRRVSALALALELSVPPLSLLALMFAGGILAAVLATRLGASWMSAHILLTGAAAVLFCLGAAWLKFGRHQLPVLSLLAAPFYVAWKIPLYLTFLFRPQRDWVRTDRSDFPHDNSDDDADGGMPNDDFPASQQPSVVDLCGVNIHAVSEAQCVAQIVRHIEQGHGGVVVTPNLDHLRRCAKDSQFAQLVDRADLVVADGMPLVWASRLQGTPLPGRVAGSDLIASLSSAAAKSGRSIFLLGGAPGTAQAAAEVLGKRYPELKIAGTFCPPLGFEKNADQMRDLTRVVTQASPDIVFVALGSPKQEKLIDRLRDKLPATWWLGVGISFSFLCGDIKRAPRWMRKAGLEWLHRLLQEPGRLARRYLVQGAPFAMRLLAGAMGRGLARRFRTGRRPLALSLDSGLGQIDVQVNGPDDEGPANGAPHKRSRRAPGHSDGNGNGDHSSNGREAVYRAFLSGFASEFYVGGPISPIEPVKHSASPAVLSHIRSLVLLGGSVRRSPLTGATERSLLDLPLEDGRSILTHWRDEAASLRRIIGCPELSVRVMVDHAAPQPCIPSAIDGVPVLVERDLTPYRGTGGVLRDLSSEYADEDVLVVANAAQSLLSPLVDLVASLAELESDVSLIAHADGTPSGLMLVRCCALRKLAAEGYLDMKEQALPAIAREFKVTHLFQTQPTGLPVRNLEEYISALQRRHRHHLGIPAQNDPFAEDRRPTFAIVEHGAMIDPDARVHDSVVLKGAVVEGGATVVRSIVCPGGVLSAGQVAIDQLIMSAEVAAR